MIQHLINNITIGKGRNAITLTPKEVQAALHAYIDEAGVGGLVYDLAIVLEERGLEPLARIIDDASAKVDRYIITNNY